MATANGADPLHEHDRIVKTLDVFFTPELGNAISLLQFPHRPREIRSSKDTSPLRHPLLPESLNNVSDAVTNVRARLKPSTNTIEMSIPLEQVIEGRTSKQRAEDLGQSVDKRDLNASTELTSQSGKRRAGDARPPLESIVLHGQGLADQTNYCACVRVNDNVFFAPLPSTVQLRPHLQYLDRAARRIKEDQEADSDASASDPDETETAFDRRKKEVLKAEPKAAAVSIKQDTGTSGAQRAANNQTTLLTPQRAQEAEPWSPLAFVDRSATRAKRVARRLRVDGAEASQLTTIMDNTANLRLRDLPPAPRLKPM